MSFERWFQIFNTIILAATGVVVWLYTRAAQRSNEIQEEPLLSLIFKDTTQPGNSSPNGIISVKNIGKGAAYNIKIERFLVKGYSYRFYLENPSLEPLESAPLKKFVRTPEGNAEMSDMMFFLTRLIPQTLRPDSLDDARKNPAIFVMYYQGVSGKVCHSAFALYSNLPPSGDIVTQFIVRGSGKLSLEKAKEMWELSERIGSGVED